MFRGRKRSQAQRFLILSRDVSCISTCFWPTYVNKIKDTGYNSVSKIQLIKVPEAGIERNERSNLGEFPKIVESMVYRIKKYNIYPIKIN